VVRSKPAAGAVGSSVRGGGKATEKVARSSGWTIRNYRTASDRMLAAVAKRRSLAETDVDLEAIDRDELLRFEMQAASRYAHLNEERQEILEDVIRRGSVDG
jgi:hypothetical protein